MKKNYNQPNTRIFNVQLHPLMEQSDATMGLGGDITTKDGFLSRDRGEWDDEDEW
ncbi:MAG: hypothetical protein IJ892_12180 [Prevotella sp.]|nr:hypothetical protein [Prevotella sp.]